MVVDAFAPTDALAHCIKVNRPGRRARQVQRDHPASAGARFSTFLVLTAAEQITNRFGSRNPSLPFAKSSNHPTKFIPLLLH